MESLWNSLRFSRKRSRSLPALFVPKKEDKVARSQDDSKTGRKTAAVRDDKKESKAKKQEKEKEQKKMDDSKARMYKKNEKSLNAVTR